jgi:hypothetical protein
MKEFTIYYSSEGTNANSPVNGMRLSFKADTPLIVKELNAQVLAHTHKATVTFSHDGIKYKIKPDGSTTVRKKKKGKPETKDKLYYRICGLTKKLKDMK